MITSNIKDVIKRFQRVEKGVPKAVENALHPGHYRQALTEIAERVLQAHIMVEDESSVVAAILSTLVIQATDDGFTARLGGLLGMSPDGAATGFEPEDILDSINHFQDLVMDWVKKYKALDEGELNLLSRLGEEAGYARIRDRVIFAIQNNPEDWTNPSSSTSFLNYLSGGSPDGGAGMAAALVDVLTEWSDYVIRTAPPLAGEKILGLFDAT